MSEKIKRYKVKGRDLPAIAIEFLPDVVVSAKDHDAALAAKEARIAELVNLCTELYQVLGALDAPEHVLDKVSAAANGEPVPEIELLPFEVAASQGDAQCGDCGFPYQKGEPCEFHIRAVSQGEEGREVPGFRAVVEAAIGDYYYERANGVETVSKIIAQHSRIVAAKDARYSELFAAYHEACVDAANGAKPARQVGGGEREQFEAWCAKEMGVPADDVIGAEGDDLWAAWQARAALAPAAVAKE